MVQMNYLLMNFLTSLFNTIQESERIPEELRSAMVPSFKKKVMCSAAVKLMRELLELG